VHFQQGIPCLLFDEFFTDAPSWLGILRQRQEHGVRCRFSGAYLHSRRPGQRRHHVHLQSGCHWISNTADGVRREGHNQRINLRSGSDSIPARVHDKFVVSRRLPARRGRPALPEIFEAPAQFAAAERDDRVSADDGPMHSSPLASDANRSLATRFDYP